MSSWRRVTRSLVVLGLGALIVGAPAVIAPSSAEALTLPPLVPGAPFDPLIPQVFVAQDRPTTTLYSGQQTAGHLNLLAQGGVNKFSYNALGFNTADNFLYGIKAVDTTDDFGTNRLVKVGQGGVATDLGAITGLPIPSGTRGNSYTQGVFGGTTETANTLYVRDYNNEANNNKMWSIDVTQTPLQATMVTITGLADGIENLADFTWNGGSLWGVSRTVIYEIYPTGPSSAMAASYPITIPSMKDRHFGAAWTYGNGNLGFQDNRSGDIFQVETGRYGPGDTLGFKLIAEFTGPASNNNDGANVIGGPVDLAIVKTGPADYSLGGAMSYTMKVTNNGPGISSGSVLTDTPPAELTNLTTSTPGCKIVDGTLNCVLGALGVGESTEVVMNSTVVSEIADPERQIINGADVLGNELDPDMSNNWDNTGSRRLPGLLNVAKTSDPATGTTVAPGQLVNYTLTFNNSGQSPVAVNELDLLADVLDDADLEGDIVAQAPLTAVAVPAGGPTSGIEITGSLDPGATATVTYSMRVKTVLPATASGKLGNFIVTQGEVPPTICAPESMRCTEHPVRGSLTWNKVNDHTPAEFLTGSEWTLTPYDRAATPALVPAGKIDVIDCVAAQPADCAGSDQNPAAGKFKIAGLTIGKYQLAETKAPAGYLRIAPIDIDVYSEFDYGNIVDKQAPGPVLPLTGGMGTAVFWGSTAGLGLLAALALFLQRRRTRLTLQIRPGA